MHRLISIFLPCLAIAIAGCVDQDEVKFEVVKSYEDPNETLQLFKERLLAAESGWNAILKPKKGDGYSLFIDPQPDEMIASYSELNPKDARLSNYRLEITESVNASITFEPGSSLDLIASAKDRTFSLVHTDESSIYLVGNISGDVLELKMASNSERLAYQSGNFASDLKAMVDSLNTAIFLYAEIDNGQYIQFQVNTAVRGALITFIEDEDGKVNGSNCFMAPSGIQLVNPISAIGIDIEHIRWNNIVKSFFIEVNGTEFELLKTTLPVIRLHYLLGEEYPQAISLYNPQLYEFPGWSDDFKLYWSEDELNLWSHTGFTLYYFDYLITKENSMTINVYYVEGNYLKIAQYPYTYVKDSNGIYSFSPLPIDTTTPTGQRAAVVKAYLPNLFTISETYTFSIEFYDAFDELGGLIAQFQSQENSQIYFTGIFY